MRGEFVRHSGGATGVAFCGQTLVSAGKDQVLPLPLGDTGCACVCVRACVRVREREWTLLQSNALLIHSLSSRPLSLHLAFKLLRGADLYNGAEVFSVANDTAVAAVAAVDPFTFLAGDEGGLVRLWDVRAGDAAVARLAGRMLSLNCARVDG